jgi:hypothetical protein
MIHQETIGQSEMRHGPRDEVHIFQPIENGFASIPITGGTARPGQVELDNPFEFYMNAKPVPTSCIPASLDIKAVNRKMPDFYYVSDCQIIVSSIARAALDELAPDTIEFIEVKMNIPPQMTPAPACYYINVLPTARAIDWPASDLSPQKPGGRVRWIASIGSKLARFRRRMPNDPLLWHELNLDDSHLAPQSYVLMRGELWRELDRRFPAQLTPWQWA